LVVPLIGLYYLYVHREELLKAKIQPLGITDWSHRRLVSAASLIGSGLFIFAAGLLTDKGGNLVLISVGLGIAAWGVLALLLNWGLGSLIFGILLFIYGIYPGQNDFVKDFGMVVTLFGVVLLLCGWEVMRIAWF